MADTLTVTIMDKGHVAQVVAVRDSGTFSTPTLRTTPDLAFIVDSGGGFERTLYGLLGKAELQGITTTSSTDDTATWRVPLNGEPSTEDGGHPEYHDAYTGESAETGTAIGLGLVTEGGYSSPAITSGTAITNNSTVAKMKPFCVDLTMPGQTIRDGSLFVFVKIEAGEYVDASDVTAVFTANGGTEYTVALTPGLNQPDTGYYAGLEIEDTALSVWQGTIDVSSAAEGLGQLHIEARGVNGALADTSVDGDPTTPVFIDNDDSHPEYVAFVDESFTINMTGTFTLARDTVIVGATSGIRAIAEEAVDNSGGGSVAVRLVRITDTGTAWTVGESINNLTTGSATIVSATETPAGVTGQSGTAVIGGYDGDTEADARATPFGGVGRAQEYLAAARLADTGVKNAGGCKIVILTRHWTKAGYYEGTFGFSAHTAQRQALRIVGDQEDHTTCFLHGGEQGVARDQSLFCTRMEHITGQPLGNGDDDVNDRLWAYSSGDNVMLVTEHCRFLGLGAEVPLANMLQNVTETAHSHVTVTDFNGGYYAGSGRGLRNTILWVKLAGKKSDAMQVLGQSDGAAYICGFIDDLRGAAADTHGDVVQFTGNCENVGCDLYIRESSYQGLFANNQDADDKLRRAYFRVFLKVVNDGDIGATAIAFNLSVDGLIVDFTTSIAPTATVGSETGKTTSFNIISETGRSDNVWIRNSAFLGWGPQLWYEDGNADAPWAAACSVNNHTINGTALGVRDTAGGDYATLFVDPWTNGGESPGNDDTDWRSKAGGPLAARVTARDLGNPVYDLLTGEAIAAGGSIGMAAEAAIGGSVYDGSLGWFIETVAPITDPADANWGQQYSGGDGSSASPFGSVKELQASGLFVDGQAIRIAQPTGIPIYGSHQIDESNITIAPGGETIRARWVNGYPIDVPTLVSSHATNDIYRCATGALGTSPTEVSRNWNTSTNADGNRYGIMDETTLVGLQTTTGWHYDSGTDTLYVSIPTGTDIDDYEFIVGLAGDTLRMTNPLASTVEYQCFEHALQAGTGVGYGLRLLGNTQGFTHTYNVYDGCQYHHFGAVGTAPQGLTSYGNHYRTAKAGNDSQVVVYSDVGGVGINTCLFRDETFHIEPWLTPAQTAFNTGAIKAIATHCDSTAGPMAVGGLKIKDCRAIWYGKNATSWPHLLRGHGRRHQLDRALGRTNPRGLRGPDRRLCLGRCGLQRGLQQRRCPCLGYPLRVGTGSILCDRGLLRRRAIPGRHLPRQRRQRHGGSEL
jgi:hypothetical protein